MSQLMARYCLTDSRTATSPRGLRPRVLLLRVRSQANPTASLSTALQAGRGISVVPVVVRAVRAVYDAREGGCVSLVLLPALRLYVVERE